MTDTTVNVDISFDFSNEETYPLFHRMTVINRSITNKVVLECNEYIVNVLLNETFSGRGDHNGKYHFKRHNVNLDGVGYILDVRMYFFLKDCVDQINLEQQQSGG